MATRLVVGALAFLVPIVGFAQLDWQLDSQKMFAPFRDRLCQERSEEVNAIVGIRHDFKWIACSGIRDQGFTRFVKGSVEISGPRGPGGRDLPIRQWPATAPENLRLPYSGPSMHWCGAGKYMIGYTPPNTFHCRALSLRPGATGAPPLTVLKLDGRPRFNASSFTTISFDDSSRGQTELMHACPNGFVLVGMHLDANIFLCGNVAP
ncbi:MAG TPA: hypothetical protein PK620_06740 [Denitromonas sp.]|uniref:hypothetical protein n=1 Tax=Denitromonas sp. TaxID=2734609 RepID=UPI001D488473|nr:hypothetical protein [Rhodocyclaceae bacterium]MCP5222935.1 hypothetical protein [Zoogloeaceae bacterium]HQU88377.1 hypothetical protein [Denitromonas sp.]HQV14595.1 hypothetical protein [Denitromonas sp.]